MFYTVYMDGVGKCRSNMFQPLPSYLILPCLFLSPFYCYFSFSFPSSIASPDLFFLLLMLQESSDPAHINNPCYPKGFNTTMKYSSIYNTECTKKPENYNPDQDLFMVGMGDSDKCGSIVKSLFDFRTCSSAQCSFNGVEQPPVTGEFMVIHRTYEIHAGRQMKMQNN